MTPTENLYFALGEMLYAIALTDGNIQREEKEKLHGILEEEFRPLHPPIDYTEIIFQVFQKDQTPVKAAVEAAKHQLDVNSHYLSPAMKKHFIKVMQKVAHVFPPVTDEEQKLINDFQSFLSELKGDPVFYNK